MTTLQAEKRNPEIKAKRLRREGYATGTLSGRGMKRDHCTSVSRERSSAVHQREQRRVTGYIGDRWKEDQCHYKKYCV